MRRIFKALILALPVVLAAAVSCTENIPEVKPGTNDAVYLQIGSVTASKLTRAVIKETKFPVTDEVSIGLFLAGDDYSDAKYKNIKYTKPASAEAWTDPQIVLQEGKATVYAYYPYEEGITDISQVPVTSSIDGDDCMWAAPIADVCKSNPSIDLSLSHALALVEITFNTYGYDSSTKITDITLSGESFSASGTLNATTGVLTTGTACGTGNEFRNTVSLSQTGSKITANCLLIPTKTGTAADARQDFKVSVTIGGKTLSATLTGDKGVIIRQGSKSTVTLNVRNGDSKMEFVSVGVDEWNDNVSGNTAKVDGHTVTFNCPDGLKYELYTESESVAIPGETTDAEKPAVIFRYDRSGFTDYRFLFNSSISNCTLAHDDLRGIITITDITDDVTANLGFGTYIPYTATAKVEPKDKDAFGYPYDESRSMFSGGSGVVAIDGEIETIERIAFDGNTSLTGVDLRGCKNLKTIKEYAFNACTHLTSVKLPEGLETIEQNAFWHMGKDVSNEADWKPLELPSTLSTIGQYAFEDSKFTSVTLPAALKTLGTDIFKYSSVRSLTIEDGAVLGRKMFNSCFKLTTVTCKSTTPPDMKADDGLFAIANEYGNKALTDIHIYVPASSVDAYKSAPGWEMYKDKISEIPTQN